MSKAMRQMLEQSGRASVASGEAVSDLASDEACGPPREHPGTGLAKQHLLLRSLLINYQMKILVCR
jgi:RNA-directed DNA polymerase